MENNCSIIVSSCDTFDDLWHPFFTLFFRYWPDCPFPVYLISNYKKYDDSRVKTISVGDDKGWSSNMKVALKQISTPYVVAIFDDFFLERRVDTEYINSLLEYSDKAKAAYVRLFPSPSPDKSFPNALNLGEISRNASYRASLQASIWDKDIFYGLLIDGETPWNVEIEGTVRSYKIAAPFLSVKEPALYYNPRTAVIRGKWNYDVVKFCRREGIKIDTQKRPIYYTVAIATFLDSIRKSFFVRKIRAVPIIGFLGAIVMRQLRRLLD